MKKIVTTDPMNYLLESLRTYLLSKVTDPRANRDSNSHFVVIGVTKRKPQYPVININHISITSQETSAGQILNSTQKAIKIIANIQIMPITKEDEIHSAKSNDELIRNLGSQISSSLLQVDNKNAIKGTYDIIDATLVGGGSIAGPDDNPNREIRMPLLFNIEFLYKW